MKSNQVGPKGPQEVESPTLQLDRWGLDWENEHTDTQWVCGIRLSELFDLPKDGGRIRLVAKSAADRYTYKVEFDVYGTMSKPCNGAFLFRALERWLRKQVEAGRPNIGIYILE